MDDQSPPHEAAPEVQVRIADSFARQGLMNHLGARLAQAASRLVQIVVPRRPELTHQLGYFHAGAACDIAGSASGYAAFTCFRRTPPFSPPSTESTSGDPPSGTTSRPWERS